MGAVRGGVCVPAVFLGNCGPNAALRLDEVRGRRATADEVDDFQAVAILEQRLRPAVARDNGSVEFDGDPVGLHGQ